MVYDKWFDCRTGEGGSWEAVNIEGQQTFLVKGQIVNIVSFVDQSVPVTATLLCDCSVTAAIGKM